MNDFAVVEERGENGEWNPVAYIGPQRPAGALEGFQQLRVRYLNREPELSMSEFAAHVDAQLTIDRAAGTDIPRDEHSEDLYHVAFASGVLWAKRNLGLA